MFPIEKGSYQEAKMNLQNAGLMLNEYKQQGLPITYDLVENLLEMAISNLDKFESLSNTIDDLKEMFEEIPII